MVVRWLASRALVWLCVIAGGTLAWSAPALAQREHAFSASFGSAGSGNGQLSRPGEIAVNETTGDVYVIDQGNKRVEEFSSTGAYIGQFNGSASPTGAFSWPNPEAFEGGKMEGAIAIDNSTNPLDPSAGDVYIVDQGHYVVDKFTASGAYVGQITGTPTNRFNAVTNIAVDASGNLWARATGGTQQTKTELREFNDASTNEYISETAMRFPFTAGRQELGFIGAAIDSKGNIYIGQTRGRGVSFIAEFNSAGTGLAEEVGGEEATGIGVDRSSDNVYIDNATTASAFTPSGIFVERFGSGHMHASEGIAVNPATGTVYTSDTENQAIDVFTSFIVPDVVTGLVSNARETTATVSGTVNPDGLPVTACEFEYGTTASYGQTAPCSPSPGAGNAPTTVSANLSGLIGLTRYHFRLKVSNANGSNTGADRTLFTPVLVMVSEESIADVSSSSAQFSAQVNPGGADTTFRFEYGPTTSYGQSVPAPEGDLGAGTALAPLSIRAEGLRSETTYHVRIVATNVLGTVYGLDQTFTTQATGGLFALPDGRQWELVSPPNKYGAGIEPLPRHGYVEAAGDGSAITYVASGPTVASSAGNPSPFWETQVLSRRGSGGWSSRDIVSTNSTVDKKTAGSSEFLFFSVDLSRALVEPPGETPLSPEATERTVYVRDNGTGGYAPLATAGNVPPGTKLYGENEQVYGTTGTPDLTHVLLESQLALTTNAKKPTEGNQNIYKWTAGRLALVNVLPDGTAATNSHGLGSRGNIRHAFSNDGSRVFWGAGLGELYMRDTAAGQTVQVDAPEVGVAPPPIPSARFQIASVTGSKVFFLDYQPLTVESKLPPSTFSGGPYDLYVYDTEAKTLKDLTVDRGGSEPANVQDMVLGASEDGSIVYFVATGALASGAEAGKDNLYVVSETGSTWSAPRFIAVLSPEDEPIWGGRGSSGVGGEHGSASRVSSNGRFLAFMSNRSLTGYDNRDASSGQPDEEVFVYDEASAHLTCVSCNPTGIRPAGVFDEGISKNNSLLSDEGDTWGFGYPFAGHWLAADIPAWDTPQQSPTRLAYQSRYLSDEGRLFFNSFESLVAQDTNGKADVYEYEPDRVGTCKSSGGCVSLISSGTSSEESAFLDASGKSPGGEEAEDVFFITQSRLTSQDYDTSFDVYDAHVCSNAVPCVTAPASPPECSSGDSCKAAPSPQPEIFGPAPSATFSGTGNVVVSPAVPVVTSRSLTAAQKLAAALRGCRKKSFKKRTVCERQARKRYRAKQSRKANATRKGTR